MPSRREYMALFGLVPGFCFQIPQPQLNKDEPAAEPKDWTCPMDADIHMDRPGKCPRCGMTLALKIPGRMEFPLSLSVRPALIRPGDEAQLTLRVLSPDGHQVITFETVHEKLLHLFIVSEDLEFFAHVHPVAHGNGSFTLAIRLPKPGMYRLLADYYPAGSVPQLAAETLFVEGESRPAHLDLALTSQRAGNLSASLRLEPQQLLAGMQSRLYYSLTPTDGLEKYLGAWGHMLLVSEDLIDLVHLHPFLVGASEIQYNVIFPRAGNYKIWSQFQRLGVVNTVAFSVKIVDI